MHVTHRTAPGSTVTSAADIAVEIGNERESTILTDPPFSWVACICDNGKENEFGTSPAGLMGRDELPSAGGAVKYTFVIARMSNWIKIHTAWENIELLRRNMSKRRGVAKGSLSINFRTKRRQHTFGSSL